MGYMQTTTVKVVRTRHRVEAYKGCTAEAMAEFIGHVPVKAKLISVEDMDADGCFAMEFEEEQESVPE